MVQKPLLLDPIRVEILFLMRFSKGGVPINRERDLYISNHRLDLSAKQRSYDVELSQKRLQRIARQNLTNYRCFCFSEKNK